MIQHKAPRDWAAFLQRKGRAGRRRRMRPWTPVVLSDYGRDRLAYQAYDQFFAPELPLRSLPVRNRYVLRMQAAFALMDWIARELPAKVRTGSVWTDFSGPPESGPWAGAIGDRQRCELQILGEVLDGVPERCRSLEAYIHSALGIAADEVHSLLWDPPRPLLLAVIPTIVRRLETIWRRIRTQQNEPDRDYLVHDHPLPDFVPQQLFSDLNLPEVEITTDSQARNHQDETFYLPIAQALRTLAPGRVTRRFGYRHAFASHWMPLPDLQSQEQTIVVEDYCDEFEEAGTFQVRDGKGIKDVRCLRPWKMHPRQPPGQVGVTSNSSLVWRTQIAPDREDLRARFEPPRGTGWDDLIQEICFYTHHQRNHALVRRFAIGALANLNFRDGSQLDATVRFVDREERDAAVGFSQESDAIVFRFRLPDDVGLSADHPNAKKIRAFRAALFQHRVQNDPRLVQRANYFQLNWLAQIYLSTLAYRAVSNGQTLAVAHQEISAGDVVQSLSRVLDMVFQSLVLPDGQQQSPRLRDAMWDLLQDHAVTGSLAECARVLWEAPDDGWGWWQWAIERYKSSLGGALLEACVQSCPQMEAGDLYLDVDPGSRPPESPPLPPGICEVWISEATIGGGGVVEELLRTYVADPRRFFRIAESALAPSDFELVDLELTRLLHLSDSDPEIQAVLAGVRAAENLADLTAAEFALRRTLSRKGVMVTHAVLSALHARVLRPGSSPTSDRLMRQMVRDWEATEAALGIELDPRVFAYLASQSTSVQSDLAAIVPLPANDPAWRFQTIYGLLWPRGYQVRAQGLSCYNPFAEAAPADREILLDLLHQDEPAIALEPGYERAVERGLATHGSVKLVTTTPQRQELKNAILSICASAVEADYLHLYPAVVAVALQSGNMSVTLDVREVLP